MSGELHLQRFVLHERSPAHQIAARAISKSINEDTLCDDTSTPSFEEWSAVLRDMRAGQVATVARIGKCRMMCWCLAYAHVRDVKKKVRETVCVGIQQDMRGNRFLMRFRSSSASLEVTSGTVSLLKHVSTMQEPGADGLRAATMACLKEFCTEVPSNAMADPKVDMDLFQILCSKIESFAALQVTQQVMSSDIQKRRLTRMATYVELVGNIMAAEFPYHDIMAAFKVFTVKDLARCKQMTGNGERQKALQCLAKVIRVNPESLVYEFFHHQPLAQKFCRVEGLSSFDAWKKAIEKKRTLPSALMAELARCGAWSASSSEVERGFSAAKGGKVEGKGQDEYVCSELDHLVLAQDVLPQRRRVKRIWSPKPMQYGLSIVDGLGKVGPRDNSVGTQDWPSSSAVFAFVFCFACILFRGSQIRCQL